MKDTTLSNLNKILIRMQKVLIAFSGGVDSSFLLKVAIDTLGRENVIAVTAVSETYPKSELKDAKRFAKTYSANLNIIKTCEFKDKRFVSNPANRCYYCKKELFTKLRKIGADHGVKYILDGSNIDDNNDYRPGAKAKIEIGVRSPLQEAGFTKKDIRAMSKKLGLSTHSKPAYACLASRIPYGNKITKEGLSRIEKAEDFLRSLGFGLVRVRAHGAIARIETEPSKLRQIHARREIISKKLKSLGFKFITLDLEGYRMGSMNEALP